MLGITETVFAQIPCIVLPWMENGTIRSFLGNLKRTPGISNSALGEIVAGWVRTTQDYSVTAYINKQIIMANSTFGLRSCKTYRVDSNTYIRRELFMVISAVYVLGHYATRPLQFLIIITGQRAS